MKTRFKPYTLFFLFFSLLTFIYAIYLRFQDLGYSEFQGDETNAIRYLGDIYGKNPAFGVFYDFLLNQKRGPGQYVINYINTTLFGFSDEFQIRFPFFVFSILAFISFYFLAKKIFNDRKIALITSLLVATNGLYIAFSRITQYQSFMYFLVPLSLFLYIVAFEKKNYKLLATSGLLFSVSLLTHYDTLGVGSFFVGFLLYKFYLNPKEYLYLIKSSVVFLAFFIVPSIIFYLPFLQGSYYEESTSGYLTGRLFGFGLMPRTPYQELGRLLLLYMPIEGWFGSFVFVALGYFCMLPFVSKIKIFNFKIPQKVTQILYILSVGVYTFALFFSVLPIKPRLSTVLIYITSLNILGLLFLSKKIPPLVFGLVFWSILIFAIYFFFIKDPRTHVYVSFMPAFIVAAYGLSQVLFSKVVYIRYLSFAVFFTFIFYVCSFYYVILIDKNPEYPWFQKSLFGRELYEVERARHRKIDGVFGFSNKRHWEEIGVLFKKGCLKGNYSSNEKDSITKFYVTFSQTYPDRPGLIGGADNLIYVEGPNSWYYSNVGKLKLDPFYSLIKTFKNKDYTVTYIFGSRLTYPTGKIFCEK